MTAVAYIVAMGGEKWKKSGSKMNVSAAEYDLVVRLRHLTPGRAAGLRIALERVIGRPIAVKSGG